MCNVRQALVACWYTDSRRGYVYQVQRNVTEIFSDSLTLNRVPPLRFRSGGVASFFKNECYSEK